MDHHGLLAIMRRIAVAHQSIHIARTVEKLTWEWKVTPLFFPESHCPFCNTVVKSNGIWFIAEGNGASRLIGAIIPTPGQPVEMFFPGHPHDTGGGHLCLGNNLTGVALLASTPNLRDCPMGVTRVPHWLKKYWSRHTCQASRDFIQSHSWNTLEANRLLTELDKI